MFSVLALFYGDYPSLAQKLLSSLLPNVLIKEFRFGLNAASAATIREVMQWSSVLRHTPITLYRTTENVGKYPLMRAMLNDNSHGLGRKLMWFDDDSYMRSEDSHWWWQVADLAKQHVQVGAVHRIRQRGQQWQEIPKQPWYTGKPVTASSEFRFATGGWWVLDTEFALRHGYPFKDLHHNGGDSILGELLRQQGHVPFNYREGTACGCESCQRNARTPESYKHGCVVINEGGRKGRRGIGQDRENYVWSRGQQPDDSHQNFDLTILRWPQ